VLGGLAVMERAPLDADLRRQVERVAASAEVLAVLIAAALAPPPAEESDESASVDLAAFLAQTARRWTGEANEKGLSFEIDRAASLPERILAPSADLARIVGNLVSNAIKFSPSGALRLRVRRPPEGGVEFAVLDEGPGLGRPVGAELFEFGYRGPEAAQPGEGIGLHVAKALTEALGGALALRDRPAGGLEAVLRLPARLCVEASRPAAAAPALPDLRGLRVLLAEDNPTNQLVATQMLSTLNATVTIARDGVEALERFEADAFDLVIVDIEMPRASGLDVIEAIRGRGDRRARTPAIALTAYAMNEHRDRIAAAGADGLISKPIVSIEAFGQAIAEHIRPRRADGGGAPRAAGAEGEEPRFCPQTFESLAATVGAAMTGELLDRIETDLAAARRAFSEARASGDVAAIRASAHIVVSVAAAFGALRLREQAALLNAAAADGWGDAARALLDACLAEVDEALRFVNGRRARC
jgi:two-component system, OmpR family, aerobic respiration control sensor histidine kinase ArcB